MAELTLTEIWIYPVKSLGGIRLRSSRVLEKGLPLDRRWMLLDEDGVFMTQRTHPQMSLLKLSLTTDGIMVSRNENTLTISLTPVADGPPVTTKVFDDTVSVQPVANHCNDWFSEMLNVNCKLVYFPEENSRPVDPGFQVKGEQVSLADAFPFLIIGEQSLADLNSRLKDQVPMNRFRPNMVFSGGEAFEEDTWRDFRIGKNRFVGVKPCGRCMITTVNQDTAEKGVEPLATLSSYRKRNGKVCFGQNLIAVDHEEIFEGDEIVRG